LRADTRSGPSAGQPLKQVLSCAIYQRKEQSSIPHPISGTKKIVPFTVTFYHSMQNPAIRYQKLHLWRTASVLLQRNQAVYLPHLYGNKNDILT
jgi:hypothetical protein